MATDWLSTLVNAAMTYYGIQQGQKPPKFYPAPTTPEEQWVTDAKKNLFGNASGFLGQYLGGLGDLNPDYKLNTNAVGNPAFMGGIKVPSHLSFTPTPAGAPPPPDRPGGASPIDPINKNSMKDPNGGGSQGSGSPVPGGGSEPFPPGYQGPAGVGGSDSPDFQRLWSLAKKYGPGVLASYFGGPLASIALSIYKHFTGSAPTPTTPGSTLLNAGESGSKSADNNGTTFGPPSPGLGFPSFGDQMPAQGALIDGVWTPFIPGPKR